MRVMSRLFADSGDIMDQKNRKAVTENLRAVYPEGDEAALLTEGLMELGERICIPNGQPLCDTCPAAAFCRAHEQGQETQYPVRSAKKERRVERKTVLLLHCGGKYALQKRPEKGLLAGLWSFPMADGHLTEQDAAGLFQASAAESLGNAKHIFTHVEWHMIGYRIECKAFSPEYVWVTPAEIERIYSVPTAFKHFKNKL